MAGSATTIQARQRGRLARAKQKRLAEQQRRKGGEAREWLAQQLEVGMQSSDATPEERGRLAAAGAVATELFDKLFLDAGIATGAIDPLTKNAPTPTVQVRCQHNNDRSMKQSEDVLCILS